jgi:hypothetical protein
VNSAGNPSTLTDRSTTDEHYDKRVERGKYEGRIGISSEVAGVVSISQLGRKPLGCKE